jgi:putative restriction endonuclease
MSRGKEWTRFEQMLALELYCRTPFGSISRRNPEIIELANRLGRTPSSVSLKMANFSALDPTITQKGMSNYSKSDAIIWEEFFEDPTLFLDKIEKHVAIHKLTYDEPIQTNDLEVREGEDIEVLSTVRKHQTFFRKSLLTAYNGKCGITNIGHEGLLVASHIIPWSKDKKNRLNPRNGILLNALHDKAFDKGLISFEDNLDLIISPKLHLHEAARPFFEDKKLRAPEKFGPDPAFLKWHRDYHAETLI